MTSSANVLSVQALEELRAALARFGVEAQQALDAVVAEIGRTLEWLQERLHYWQREVERGREAVQRAKAALARCRASGYYDDDGHYHEPDCSAYEMALAEMERRLELAEAELANAKVWFAHVQQAVADYEVHARRMQHLVSTELPRACAFLERKRAELDRYMVIWQTAGMSGSSSPIATEASTLSAQRQEAEATQDSIVAGMQKNGLDIDIWTACGLDERISFLQKMEQVLAEAQGRPSVSVKHAALPQHEMGRYNPESREITIDTKLLEHNDGREAIRTVAHEDRHAYQHYAIEHPGFHPDYAAVEAWRTNYLPGNYLTPKRHGWWRYRTQPVEMDAFHYGNMILSLIVGGGRR